MPKSAPVLDNLSADDNMALTGDVEVVCALHGHDGENPEDCTTHEHQHVGTVLVAVDHMLYTQHVDGFLDDLANEVCDEDLGEGWTVAYVASGVRPGNVVALTVTVTP